MYRQLIAPFGMLVLLSGTAFAQIGNPAGMGADTRMTEPGIPAPHQTNNQDRLFAQLLAAGGLAEVEFGNIAGDKAKADAVRQFADMMVRDHTDANAKLKDLAEAARIPLPTELDPDHQVVRDRLDKLTDEAFDEAYIKGADRRPPEDCATAGLGDCLRRGCRDAKAGSRHAARSA